MEQVITIRIHLNATHKENGCLKVIPKSHKLGILSQPCIEKIVSSNTANYCEANECAALVMHPLLLHASEKVTQPHSRKILHLEYSSYQLPLGIGWA